MKVEILKYAGWDEAIYCARKTQNKKAEFIAGYEPTLDFKKRLLVSNHSPLRLVNLLIEIDLMNKTQNHLVRHKHGVEWFVSTLRNDIVNSNDLDVTRLTERSLVMSVNLSALVNMCRVRTCKVSELETVELFEEIIKKLVLLEPTLFNKKFFNPNCSQCREAFNDCNKNKMNIKVLNKILGV